MSRIGFFFGSFDPIHIGHMAIVNAVANSDLVDEILIVPAWHNPNKPDQSSFKHRFKMIELYGQVTDNLYLSAIEEQLAKQLMANYIPTYRTLIALKASLPEDEKFIITTKETFEEIPTWNFGDTILKENKFIIVGEPVEHESVVATISIPQINVHSTFIRDMAKKGDYLVPYVPLEIEDYIYDNELYK